MTFSQPCQFRGYVMIRSVVIAVAVIGITAHSASAQQLTYNGLPLKQAFSASVTLQAAPAPVPSAASIAQPTFSVAPRRQASPQPAQAKGKSFWHTPWPYVIAGAAAATIIIVANSNQLHPPGGGY